MRFLSALLVLGSALSAGCPPEDEEGAADAGGDTNGGGLALSALAAARSSAICGYLTRCCNAEEIPKELKWVGDGTATDLASCLESAGQDESDYVARIQQGVDRGTITYDGVMAASCVAAIEAEPCSGGIESTFGTHLAACRFHTAKAEPGAPCINHLECKAGWCDDLGKCAAAGSEGDICPGVGGENACQAGLYCDAITTGKCEQPQAQGESDCTVISCASGLSCQNGKCEPLAELGAPCDHDTVCKSEACTSAAEFEPLKCTARCDGR